ncbi:heme ABC transporter ATP-binding protein [Chitinibacter tainanensis]|uniref:heme ABC transporter ATP-binding protein n=1 Tax=Chitinibacter tainanensis TaxID=230667 RepID=UPI0003FEBE29|nr:heme ABC transporter ATP-binding protein [Chitinibacter tainanensis]
MLQLDQVSFQRGERPILRGIDLTLPCGEITAILGANGAGKSTLLQLLTGELAPSAGRALLDGQPLAQWPAAELAARRVVLPQQAQLTFQLSAHEVIAMGGYPFPQLSPAEMRALLLQAAALADVSELLLRPYPQLSGGEQQRVQLARVLLQTLAALQHSTQPVYLLLDEPTASLDPRHQQHVLVQLQSLLASLPAGQQLAVGVILHDVNLAARYCQRLVLLAAGQLVASGPVAQALTGAHLEQTYQLPATVLPHPLHAGQQLVVFA